MRRMRDEAGLDAWVWLVIMIANFLYCGAELWDARGAVHMSRRTVVQEAMYDGHVRRVWRFLGIEMELTPGRLGPLPERGGGQQGWRRDRRALEEREGLNVTRVTEMPEVQFPPKDFEEKTAGGYDGRGGGVTKAYRLTVLGIVRTVPPPGAGGSVEATDWASGEHREILLNPGLVVKEPEEPPPNTEVLCDDEEWGPVARLMCGRGVTGVAEESEIPVYEGEMQLNGLFGVKKKWAPEEELRKETQEEEKRLVGLGWEPLGLEPPTGDAQRATWEKGGHVDAGRVGLYLVVRLIMNLLTTDAFLRDVTGDVSALPWVGAWAQIILVQGESMLLYGEDQTVMFYLYALPRVWRRWFGFKKRVRGDWIGRRRDEWLLLWSRVVPMGWLLAVMIAQNVHRNQMIWEGLGAGLCEAEEWRKDRMVPLLVEELFRKWWQVYVDNWDAGNLGPWPEMAKLVGLPDSRQEAVRACWDRNGIPRSAEKSVTGALKTVSLGKELNGRAGWQGSTLERMAAVLGMNLWMMGQTVVTGAEARSGVGSLIHVTMERRSLFGLLMEIFARLVTLNPVGDLGTTAEDEILACCAAMPLAVSDLRAPVDPMVGATDACETGGGACESQGLAVGGGDVRERWGAENVVPVFLITDRDQGAGLLAGLDVLGWDAMAVTCLGMRLGPGRCVRNCWPTAETVEWTGASLKEETVAGWARAYGRVERWIWSSVLPDDGEVPPSPESRWQWAEATSRVALKIGGIRMIEQLHVMPGSLEQEEAENLDWILGLRRWLLTVKGESWTCWTSWGLAERDLVQLGTQDTSVVVEELRCDCPVGATGRRQGYWELLEKGRKRVGESVEEEKRRIKVIPGVVTAWLLHRGGGLWGWRVEVWGDEFLRRASERMLTGRREEEPLHITTAVKRRRPCAVDATAARSDEVLAVVELLRRVDGRGSDVRLDVGSCHRAKVWPREAVNPHRWLWRIAQEYGWQHEAHVNILELEALFLHVKRRFREKKAVGARFVQLVDSQVVAGVMGKGRSSSKKLNGPARRLGGLLLGCHGYMVAGWCKTAENPADLPSRRWKAVRGRKGVLRTRV